MWKQTLSRLLKAKIIFKGKNKRNDIGFYYPWLITMLKKLLTGMIG